MYQLFAFVIACGLSAPAAAIAGDDKGPEKMDINGTWKAVGLVDAGKKVPAADVEKAAEGFVFKDGKYKDLKDAESGAYTIDASKSPPAIDFIVAEGDEKGKTQLGLVKLDGDVLTIALGEYGGKDRPKGFDGTDARWVLTLRRSK